MGGNAGPSAAEIAAENQAAAQRAQSETNLINSQQAIEKDRANKAAVAAAANQANATSLLAQTNQQLIAGVAADKKNNKLTLKTTNPAAAGNILANSPTAVTGTPSGVGG